MADRYTYLPSLAPFLVLGLAFARGYGKLSLLKKWGLKQKFAGGVLAFVLLVFLSFLTVMQIGIWKNSLTFWDYIIENTPEQVPFVYGNRGIAYETKGEYSLALKDLDIALVLQPDSPRELYSRGHVYADKGMDDRAIEDFTRAVTLNPDYFKAFNSRGVSYGKKGLLENATRDFDHAISLKPDFYDALCNRCLSLMLRGQYDMAVESCTSAIKLDGRKATAYINRAHARLKMGERVIAIADLRMGCVLGSEVACMELEKPVKN
jgi:tetratricopeptide (TPR) repeat protein